MNPAASVWVLRIIASELSGFTDGDQIPDKVGRAIGESPEDTGSDDDYRYSFTSDESDNTDDMDN